MPTKNSRKNVWTTSTLTIHDRTEKEAIQLNPARLELILRDAKEIIKKCETAKTGAIAYFLCILSLLPVLLTGDFKDFFGFSAEYWRAANWFILAIIILLFLYNTLNFLLLCGKDETPEQIVQKLKRKTD